MLPPNQKPRGRRAKYCADCRVIVTAEIQAKYKARSGTGQAGLKIDTLDDRFDSNAVRKYIAQIAAHDTNVPGRLDALAIARGGIYGELLAEARLSTIYARQMRFMQTHWDKPPPTVPVEVIDALAEWSLEGLEKHA